MVDLKAILVTVVGVALGVGLGLLFGAWLIQQAYGVLL